MEGLVELFGAAMEGAVSYIGERYGCVAGIMAFFLLFAVFIGLMVLAFYWYA